MARLTIASSDSMTVRPSRVDTAQVDRTATSARNACTASTASAENRERDSGSTGPPAMVTAAPRTEATAAPAPSDRHRTRMSRPASCSATISQVVPESMMTASPSSMSSAVACARRRLISTSCLRRMEAGRAAPRRGARKAPPWTRVTRPSWASSARSRRMVMTETPVSRDSACTLWTVVGLRARSIVRRLSWGLSRMLPPHR